MDSEPLDLRKMFMVNWLLVAGDAVYSETGGELRINLRRESFVPDLTVDALVDIVSFMLEYEGFPALTRLTGLSISGLDVAEVEIDFNRDTVSIVLRPPQKYGEVLDLEAKLDNANQLLVNFIVMTQTSMLGG